MNPSERIDQLIAELTDWRGKRFASIRNCPTQANTGLERATRPSVQTIEPPPIIAS